MDIILQTDGCWLRIAQVWHRRWVPEALLASDLPQMHFCSASGVCGLWLLQRVRSCPSLQLPEALLAPDNPMLADQARSGTTDAGLQAFAAFLDQLGQLSTLLSWAGFLQCLTVVVLVLRLAARW